MHQDSPESLEKALPPGSLQEMKQQSSAKEELSAQLVSKIQAMVENKVGAEEGFLTFVERLSSLDKQTPQMVLTLTRQRISAKADFLKRLEFDLNSHLKPVVNLLIDSLHSTQMQKGSLAEQQCSTIKLKILKIQNGIIAISLIEKLIFPQDSLQYCQELDFFGFHEEDKRQLGHVLQKIDTEFDIESWLLRWDKNRASIGRFRVSFFRREPYRASNGVTVQLSDPQQDHRDKNCCY